MFIIMSHLFKRRASNHQSSQNYCKSYVNSYLEIFLILFLRQSFISSKSYTGCILYTKMLDNQKVLLHRAEAFENLYVCSLQFIRFTEFW